MKPKVKVIENIKSESHISQEWDSIIEKRFHAIKQGKDKSFIYISLPAMVEKIKEDY